MWVLDQGVMPDLYDNNYMLVTGFESLVDQSSYKRTLTLGGSAVLSTAQAKTGAQSLALFATNSYLDSPVAPLGTIGTGDYTVEFDVYLNSSASGYADLFAFRHATDTSGLTIRVGNAGFGNVLQLGSATNVIPPIYNSTITRAAMYQKWTNIVVQRKAGKTSLRVNGVLQTIKGNNGSGTAVTEYADTKNMTATGIFRLGNVSTTAYATQACFIDNFKFSKVARY